MNSRLLSLPLIDVIHLCGFQQQPLIATGGNSNDFIRQCVEWIAGLRTWHTVVVEALEEGDMRKAWRARCHLHSANERVNDLTESQLAVAWLALLSRCSDWRRRITSLPPPAESSELYAEVASLLSDCAALSVLTPSLPNSIEELDHLLSDADKLERLAADADSLFQLLDESRHARRRQAIALGKEVFSYALEQLEATSKQTSDYTILLALRAIPDLVVESNIGVLQKFQSTTFPLSDDFAAELHDRERFSQRTTSTTLFAQPPDLPPVILPVRLSAASQTLFSAETPASRGVSDLDELNKHIEDMVLVTDDLDIGTRWLRISRATSHPELLRLTLGLALSALSRGYIDRNQTRLAAELAKDAVISLCLPKPWFNQDFFDTASFTLVAAKLWTRMSTFNSQRVSIRPSHLASNPDLMLQWMRDHDAVDVVAELWADLPDHVDDLLFDVLKVCFAHEVELNHACAEAALTAPRLRGRPVRTAYRLLLLLQQSTKTTEFVAALHESMAELEASPAALSPSSRALITKKADFIRDHLVRHTSDSVAILLATRLSDLLFRLASVDSSSGDAKIAISCGASAFYPRECNEDVMLPVVILIDRTGGPASEMSVQISYEGAADRWKPTIERAEFVVPPLNPGDSYTGYALLSFPAESAQKNSTWSFRATLLRGSDIIFSSRFSISLRERQSVRPNPFSAGQAIADEQFFVGRERQLKSLLDALCADRRDITPLIVGLRRIGKTSLLKRLLNHEEIQLKYITDFWDVQDLQQRSTTFMFLTQLAGRIRAKLTQEQSAKVRFRRDEFRDDPYVAFETFCDDLTALSLSKMILIGIDEFDHLVRLIRKSSTAEHALDPMKTLQPQTLGALRKMLMKGGCVKLILAGLPEILSISDYDDRLFGLVQKVDVGPFTESEANRVIAMAEPDVTFLPRIRAQLHDISGLQPYLLQLICSNLFARVSTSGRDQATSIDIDEVVSTDILPHESYFTDYLSQIRREDRSLLRALALAQKAVSSRRRFVTPSEVVNELWKSGESMANVGSTTLQLRSLSRSDRPLVAESNDHRGNFRLVIGLLTERLVVRGAIS